MEAEILKALKFELGGPTVKSFLRCVSFVDSMFLFVLIWHVLEFFPLACWFTLYALPLFAGDSLELVKRMLM